MLAFDATGSALRDPSTTEHDDHAFGPDDLAGVAADGAAASDRLRPWLGLWLWYRRPTDA